MCNPVMAVQIGLAVAGSAAQVYNQKQVQKAERQNYKYLKTQADKDANASYSAIARQQEQEHIAAQQTIQETMDRSLSAQSSAAASAAESGAGGASVGALMREYEMSRMTSASRVSQQRAWSAAQSVQEGYSVRAQQQARTYQALPRSPGPDYLGAALSIGGAAVTSYYQNSTYDPALKKRVLH